MLRCESLRKSFGGMNALNGVSLSFPEAGVVAIIGPNGAGKSTLLNVLTGFARASAGRSFVGSRETTRMPPFEIAGLGVARTFQEVRLVQQVSVVENVLLACPSRRGESLVGALTGLGVAAEEKRNREDAIRWLQFVGLEGVSSQTAGNLSYGQQKLLSLACCIATGAQVLLLDEPVAGVHPELIERIVGMLRILAESGKLVVLIEHDLAAVRRVADLLIVMDHGEIIATGAPAEVLDRPEIIEAYVG